MAGTLGELEQLLLMALVRHERPVRARYPDRLGDPLGRFLLPLKRSGDQLYRLFLNKYGDLEYSEFRISASQYLEATGVYAYFHREDLVYVERCKDSMRKRVNQGYGKIHPKNCYLDGQTTNCHLNAEITRSRNNVTLWIHELDHPDEIEAVESKFIRRLRPTWNIQGT